MPELYTQENHVMYLLSGGDIQISPFIIKGPTSSIPLTQEEAYKFRDQVNDVSGIRYHIPLVRTVYNICCDPSKSYWYGPKSNLVVYRPLIYHGANIIDTAYVVLIKFFK